MYDWLVSLDNSLYDQQYQSPDQSFAVKRVPLLDKALYYPFSISFNCAVEHPVLHKLARKFSTPLEEFRVGLETLLQSLQQQRSESLAEISHLIVAARNVFDQLHDVPASPLEWKACSDGLARYLRKFEEWRSCGFSLPSMKAPPSSSESESPLPTTSVLRPFSNNNAEQQFFREQIVKFRGEKDLAMIANSFSDDEVSPAGLWDMVQPRPKATAATLALCGWMYYGQVESFSIYIRVFIKLVQQGGARRESVLNNGSIHLCYF